ncbi:hypothetical protein [Microbulbifer sp. TYP-18]|uniref:hypothetical protein n=1 Tax=Microbulbifer sp. TYP-18 TaxID=3230024 RepID=UPI0034C627C9
MKKLLSIAFLLALSSNAFAAPAYYSGTINRIWAQDQDGGFIITYEGTSNSLSDCKHQYAYFVSSVQSPEMLKNSLSIALSAFHAGATVGVVVDKDLNGEYCHALSIDLRK